MTEVLIATDADAVFDEVEAALADETTRVVRVREGSAVGEVVASATPDLVILDLQIGNMGGIAACMHLRLEAGDDRLPAGAGAHAPRPRRRRLPGPPVRAPTAGS